MSFRDPRPCSLETVLNQPLAIDHFQDAPPVVDSFDSSIASTRRDPHGEADGSTAR